MRLLPVLLAATMIAGAAPAQPTATGKPMYGAFGFDTAGMDLSVKPPASRVKVW